MWGCKMKKLETSDFEYHSDSELRLVQSLIDCEIENAKLSQKYEMLLVQSPISKIDLSDPERHTLIHSLKSHNPPHLAKPKKDHKTWVGLSKKSRKFSLNKSARKLIVAYILVFLVVYYLVRLIG